MCNNGSKYALLNQYPDSCVDVGYEMYTWLIEHVWDQDRLESLTKFESSSKRQKYGLSFVTLVQYSQQEISVPFMRTLRNSRKFTSNGKRPEDSHVFLLGSRQEGTSAGNRLIFLSFLRPEKILRVISFSAVEGWVQNWLYSKHID